MCNHFETIYRQLAADYERLVAREDRQGNLFAALNAIRPLSGLRVVEFGAGTGRLTRLLSVQVERVHAFDIAPSMLRRAQVALPASGMRNWTLALGDNARMPVAAGCADVVIEGWSFGHVTDPGQAQNWRARIDAMLAEMARILKPGGTAILIETMGTGQRQPQAPYPELAQLYAYWQEQCGFAYRWIRTDYQFASLAEAEELLRFFFGAELAEAALASGKLIVPECTGIWWKHFPA